VSKDKPVKLPELPDGLEWVVNADHDRFTVHLSACPKKDAPVEDSETSSDDKGTGGYLRSHTHRHDTLIKRDDWEAEVFNCARHLLLCYEESINHAQWADEIMRRSW
jgi:hypothetical protein